MYASDLKHPQQSLEDKLHYLYDLNRDKKIDLSFRPPYLQLLEAFGNPHLSLPPVIHVAGTNGKGSIVAILRSILEESGYKVHAYTSPHLRRFNERLYLAGDFISDDALESLIDEAIELNKGQDVTFFEITTAMAFAAFSRVPADFTLLEVGLGGRLDCTNVIDAPLVSVISHISLDHKEHLGESLTEIAAEKAGIIKPGVPCVIAPQTPETLENGAIEVFQDIASEKNAPLYLHGAEWVIDSETENVNFTFAEQHYSLPAPNLIGAHQIQNAGTALATLKTIEKTAPEILKLSNESIEKALKNVKWSARLQELTGSLGDLPPEYEVFLDGGHNRGAGEALAQQAEIWRKTDGKKLHLILGMMAHKSIEDFLEPLLPCIESITYVQIPGEPHALPSDIALSKIKDVSSGSLVVSESTSIAEATADICTKNKQPGRILIAGSVYMAGHVLQLAGN